MNKKTIVVSAFPGCGKSYCFDNYQESCDGILDSDSSDFSWVKDEDGNNTKVRNPNFPSNYIKHINKNIGTVGIIFVSSHAVVRNELKDNNINYTLVYPSKKLKDSWMQRFKDRGNDIGFIDFISNNWDSFIDNMSEEKFPSKISIFKKDGYISEILDYITTR